MQTKFDPNAQTITITADLSQVKPSRSGASTIFASTHGQRAIGMLNGKPLYAQVNIFQLNAETPEMFSGEGQGEQTVQRRGPRAA